MKDLKNEYQKMIETDVPDLWDRIESSLPEREETRPAKKNRRKFYYMSAAAAACVCAAIIIPLAVMSGNAGSSSSTAEAAPAAEAAAVEQKTAASAAAETVFDAAEAEEAAPESAEPEALKAAASGDTVESMDVKEAANTYPLPDSDSEKSDAESYSYYSAEELEKAEAAAEKIRKAVAQLFGGP